MKRSRVVMLTLAGMSLGVTGCRRAAETVPPGAHGDTPVLHPKALNPYMLASLPAFTPGANVSGQTPPHNAYDPQLGYYHQPCQAWFPYPYDHYDSRWGYYRCGRWSRHHSTRLYPIGSHFYRPATPVYDTRGVPLPPSAQPSTPVTAAMNARPTTNPPEGSDYTRQPDGAPVHTGVPHTHATATRSSLPSSSFVSRGGFGSTGRSFGFFSGT
jgi:hypothetical protein